MLVVQRYGPEIAGGSEQCCRLFAEHLAQRGHAVEVATSCALHYTDWANHFDPGSVDINGVTVHRFRVDRPRNESEFSWFNRVNDGISKVVPLDLQERWLDSMGPRTLELPNYLRSRAGSIDAFIFFTYLYYPTVRGMESIAGLAPVVFFPTAHREPAMNMGIQDRLFRLPDAFAYLTPEERELVDSTFGFTTVGEVLGVGVDLDATGDSDRFRRQVDLADDPYLLFVGRVDPGKGSLEVVDFFRAYKERKPGPLKLVIVGQQVHPVGTHPDVISTGFIDEQSRNDAIAGCAAYLQPSYFESFSMSLTEAWALGRPALVQGKCDVLVGQANRARGGLAYDGFLEFEAAVDVLVDDRPLGDRLGAAGREYVEREYDWRVVTDRCESLIRTAIGRHASRKSRQSEVLGLGTR